MVHNIGNEVEAVIRIAKAFVLLYVGVAMLLSAQQAQHLFTQEPVIKSLVTQEAVEPGQS